MLRILLVEDDRLVAAALKRTLSLGGLVALATSCSDALGRLEGEPFDVVLTDVDLGDARSGLSLLDEVRTRWPSTRRIAMSGRVHATTETLLVKPLSRSQVEAILQGADVAPTVDGEEPGWGQDEPPRPVTAAPDGTYPRAMSTPRDPLRERIRLARERSARLIEDSTRLRKLIETAATSTASRREKSDALRSRLAAAEAALHRERRRFDALHGEWSAIVQELERARTENEALRAELHDDHSVSGVFPRLVVNDE